LAWRAVTDDQWARIREQLPQRPTRKKGGRPQADDCQCCEGILWILWMGAPWSELPARYGLKSVVHRRLTGWAESGVLLDMWRAFLDQLEDRKKVCLDACFIDGMFITAEKGVRRSGRRKEAREYRSWYWPMARGLHSEHPGRRSPPRRSNAWSRRCGISASAVATPSAAGPGV
jgi:transposase